MQDEDEILKEISKGNNDINVIPKITKTHCENSRFSTTKRTIRST